jgi:exosortase
MATSTTTLNPADDGRTSSSQGLFKIALPYAIAIASQLPMLLLYFRDLSGLPHYQFFPFSVLATAVFAFWRWPRDVENPFQRSWLSNILLVGGLFCGLVCILFQAQWFAAFSVMLLVASLLTRTIDGESLGSLGLASLPFFTCLMLPMRQDTRLIVWLQRVSASITSMILDLVGLKHHREGNVIRVPGTEGYGIEEMCSGVQSFFTLFFFAVVLIVFFRRAQTNTYQFLAAAALAVFTFVVGMAASIPVLYLIAAVILLYGLMGARATLVIASAVFWSIFMNTVRIVTIPIAQQWFGIDLVHGLAHALLGYAVLIAGILLLFSTDQLIQFVLGPQDPDGGIFVRLAKSLNKKKKSSKRKRRSISTASKGLIWTSAVVLALCGVVQVGQVGKALANPNIKIHFFDPNVTIPFEEGDIPNEIANWQKVDYKKEIRNRSADFGLRSDGWQFRAPRCSPYVSFDQPFPAWHELTTCYKNAGWKLIKRSRVESNSKTVSQSGERPWPYIEATFKKETGEHAYLLFSFFDAQGDALNAPATWGGVGSYFMRLRGRMAHQWRSKLFQSECYQNQVFVQTNGPISDDLRTEVRDRYLAIREIIRQRFLEKQNLPTAGGSTTEPLNSATTNSSTDLLGEASSFPQ